MARHAKHRGLPAVALTGIIGEGATATRAHGINAFAGIIGRPCTLDEAMADAAGLATETAENVLRMIAIGIDPSDGPSDWPVRLLQRPLVWNGQ